MRTRMERGSQVRLEEKRAFLDLDKQEERDLATERDIGRVLILPQ